MDTYLVTVNDKEFKVSFSAEGKVTMPGVLDEFEVRFLGGNVYSVRSGTSSIQIVAQKTNNQYLALLGNNQQGIVIETERDRLLKQFASAAAVDIHRYEIHAPMPALIVKLEVSVGDEVKENQGLIVLEAMKMENEIRSHQAGRVKEIYVTPGKAVDKGELLMLLE